jgi:hypothetical protein
MPRPPSELKGRIAARIAAGAPFRVSTPVDFLDLGNRGAVDKALQRLARAGEIRRIDRGLYDKPRTSGLTGTPTPPDYWQVIEALTRRDQTRMLVDGMTAANDLGLTDAVPARVVVHTDARRRSIRLGNLTIEFRKTAPSRLYWAGRPAMRIVQALHWLKDMLPTDRGRIMNRLRVLLDDPDHGSAIREDLREGMPTLPIWMQGVVRELLGGSGDDHRPDALSDALASRPASYRREHGDDPDHLDDHDDPDGSVEIDRAHSPGPISGCDQGGCRTRRSVHERG